MSIIANIFKNPYSYYKEIGIETIKQKAGQVEQVTRSVWVTDCAKNKL